jgi:hypothetical protein
MARIRDTPEWRAKLDDLLASVLAEEPLGDDTDLFGATLQLIATVGQVRPPMEVTTQLLRAAGELLDPDRRYVLNAAESLQAIRARDPQGILTALVTNLFAETELNRFPLASLGEAFSAVLRAQPGAVGNYSADDYRLAFEKMRDWLRDERKGAERLYRVILSR